MLFFIAFFRSWHALCSSETNSDAAAESDKHHRLSQQTLEK